MKTEFIPLTWASVLALFAAGFLSAEAMYTWKLGGSPAGEIFLAVMFMLFARSDARIPMGSGSYALRRVSWRQDVEAFRPKLDGGANKT